MQNFPSERGLLNSRSLLKISVAMDTGIKSASLLRQAVRQTDRHRQTKRLRISLARRLNRWVLLVLYNANKKKLTNAVSSELESFRRPK